MSCEPSLIPPSNSQPSLSQPTSLTFDNILGEAPEDLIALRPPSVCLFCQLIIDCSGVCLPTINIERRLLLLQLPMYRYVWALIEEGQTLNYRWLSGCCWLFLESKDRPDLFTHFEFSLGFVEKKRHHNKIFFALSLL